MERRLATWIWLKGIYIQYFGYILGINTVKDDTDDGCYLP